MPKCSWWCPTKRIRYKNWKIIKLFRDILSSFFMFVTKLFNLHIENERMLWHTVFSYRAKLYNCTNGTKNINKAVKRNMDRLPDNFMFRLTYEEYNNLMFQIGTSNEKAEEDTIPMYLLNKELLCVNIYLAI